jgi:hypothetical protein
LLPTNPKNETMNDKHFYADADTPFHVWVRERGVHGARWVLRHASQVMGAEAASSYTRSRGVPTPSSSPRA